MFVFVNDAALTPYKKRYNGRPVEMSGLFVGWPDGNYILLNGEKQGDPLEIIYHEYTHHYLGSNLNNIPPWFNEGLAECYSAFRSDDKTASIGLTQEEHVRYLREHDLLPLHDLFAIKESSADYNEGERRGVFYAESWALMHYLIWDKPDRKPQFLRFLDRIGHGEDPDKAFPASFGTSYQTLENELSAHVRQARFVYTALKIADLAIDDNARTVPMKREEVLFRLGDLLVHVDEDRAAEADDLFREARRLAPGYAGGYAGLAYDAGLAGRNDEAVTLFEKSVELEPDDPMISFHFGQRLARRRRGAPSGETAGGVPSDVARARELFGRAIQLRPDFAEAYVEYARTMIDSREAPGPAIHLLEAARPLLPSRADIVGNLAILHARKGDGVRAHELVENVLAWMADPRVLAQTRDLVRQEETDYTAMQGAAAREAAARQAAAQAEGAAEDDPVGAGSEDIPPLPQIRTPVAGDGGTIDLEHQEDYVTVYNRAVTQANRGDYKGAIALLEALFKRTPDEASRNQIVSLVQKLRNDAARLHKPTH